jgi:hypothetical protein
VLSQVEILDHYNNGAGKYYASSTDTTTVAQVPASDYKPVSYTLPDTTLCWAKVFDRVEECDRRSPRLGTAFLIC